MVERIGSGYQVDAQALHGFAQTAGAAGQSVDESAGKIGAALGLGVPGGLDIGAAVQQAQAAWSARLAELAEEATAIGASLTANATSYQQTESELTATFMRGRFAA